MPDALEMEGAVAAMGALFEPDSIAVAGASPDVTKPGGRCLAFLRQYGYGGPIHPINPRYEEIDGERCHASLRAIGAPVGLLILIVPARAVPDYVREAIECEVGAVVICASGFSETGQDGAALESEVRALAQAAGLPVVGPNSLGLLDLNSNLAATFSTALQQDDLELTPGPIAFVSQSGAMGAAIFMNAQAERIPAGRFVSTGNETVLDFADFLDHLGAADDVSVVLGYIEGVDDGRRLVSAARRARAQGTTVAVLKAGTSDAGRAAAQSHTGSMTGSAHAYDAAFRRAGILQAGSPRQLLDTAIALSAGQPARGNRIGVVSMSGGAGVMIADRAGEVGLEVPVLSDATRARLAEVLPVYAGMRNPVDLGGVYSDPAAIEACARLVAADPGVDVLVVFLGLSPLMAGVIEQRLENVRSAVGKPVVVAWLAGPAAGVRELRRRGIPAYEDPVRAVDAVAQVVAVGRPLGSWAERAEHSLRSAETEAWLRARGGAGTVLDERETKALLARYDIPVVPERFVTTPAQALAAGAELGVPLAVKGAAEGLVHKSDAGAIRLAVDPAEAGAAFEAVTTALRAVGCEPTGAVVQPMAEPGLELLVGATHDPQFGPLVTVGLGGVLSEALADIAVELAPITRTEAFDMLDRLRARALLDGFRGAVPRDRDAVADVIVGVAQLALDAGPLLAELDLNPVVVHSAGAGCLVLDGTAILGA